MGEYTKTAEAIYDGSQVIRVRLIGEPCTTAMQRRNVIGACHNKVHPGKLTKKLLESHDCIGKKCPFLEKYEETPFWQNQKRIEEKRAQTKAEKRKKKLDAIATTEERNKMREFFQQHADATNSNIHIVRVEHPKTTAYIVFYVSDNAWKDWDEFTAFRNSVQSERPWCRISMRHIRDANGRFVTREEYSRKSNIGFPLHY